MGAGRQDMTDTKCKCPMGLPPHAVKELLMLSVMVTGESLCPVHDPRKAASA